MMVNYDTCSDVELVNFLQQGNEKAFEVIYDRYWEKLFAIAYHYANKKHLAEEIVQDVFMSLWDRRDKVVIQSLSSYLATAAKFAILAALKKEFRLRQFISESPVTSANEGEPVVHARFLKNYVSDQIKALPEQCRIVYIYSREEQLSVVEIAKRMDLSPKTVENHLGRALRVIRGNVRETWT